MAALLFQARLPEKAGSRLWQAAYVHVYNGLYISTLANRLIERYWPVYSSKRAI